jgi:hypothetical protein
MQNLNYQRKQERVFFGVNKQTKESIYLTLPEWQCDWYWALGWMGNRNCHYHLKNYAEKDRVFKEGDKYHLVRENRNMCMYDALLEDYELNPAIKERLWEFCDLILSAYALKKAAEVIGRGGYHYTETSAKNDIMDKEMVDNINNVKLPAIFKALETILLTQL